MTSESSSPKDRIVETCFLENPEYKMCYQVTEPPLISLSSFIFSEERTTNLFVLGKLFRRRMTVIFFCNNEKFVECPDWFSQLTESQQEQIFEQLQYEDATSGRLCVLLQHWIGITLDESAQFLHFFFREKEADSKRVSIHTTLMFPLLIFSFFLNFCFYNATRIHIQL